MENKNQDKDYLYKIRHSAEHVMNQAIEELWPNQIKRAIGPAIDEGFYNDSRWEGIKLTENDFEKIEKRMQEIIDADLPFTCKEVSEKEAREMFKENPFKQDLIDEFVANGDKLSVYITGTVKKPQFIDLCKGPHVDKTSEIVAFKLVSIAGAYWRGNEKNEMLTRIYGTAFASKPDLENYLHMLEEAKKRDHRKLGKELDLFTFSEYVGGGLPLYTPKGALIRRLLNDFIEEEQKALGYTQVWTPQIAKASLFQKSGHYDKYKDDMFKVVSNYSDEEMYLKPMNCPQHTQIFASKMRSYRDLPIRYSDFAMLYRDEKPGELSGLARVRGFSTDDTHVFCTEEQVDSEIDNMLQMTKKVMGKFDFKYRYRLSTRDPKTPEKYLGDPKTWDKVEKWAVDIMQRNDIPYYDGPGEAAFYAPKMDLMATDAIGREWQLSTVQIDYVQPERFELKYIDADGTEKTPIMLHRAVLGSAERFMMIMIEHFAGAFPLWLAPVQVRIIPISDKFNEHCEQIKLQLEKDNLRAEIDTKSETMGNKIRKAQEEKIPYMLVIGEKEINENKVSVRTRDGKQSNLIDLESFTQKLRTLIIGKSLICDI